MVDFAAVTIVGIKVSISNLNEQEVEKIQDLATSAKLNWTNAENKFLYLG